MDRIGTASMRALRGESAYELAVRKGFVGTVEERLATLGGPVSSVNGRLGDVALDKADVGLSNVDNTSDAAKPVSAAQQAALNGKSSINHDHDTAYAPLDHTTNTSNPHAVAKAQVGLANTDNTSDADKPISTAQYRPADRAQQKSGQVRHRRLPASDQ